MHRIFSFVRLDFYTLKPYGKSLLMLLALAILMTMTFQSLSTLCFYLMMCLIMVMVYPFSIGETNKLDTLFATLPLQRRDVVVGRYAFALCMELAVVLLVLGLSWVFSIFAAMEFVLQEIVMNLSIASFLFCAILSIQYPIYFKLGYNKAKFIAYAPMLLVFLIVLLLPKLLQGLGVGENLDELLQWLLSNRLWTYAAPVIFGHALLAPSYRLSRKFYENRDI